MTTELKLHPLRLAYMRTLQAILAIEIVRFDVDAALGGNRRWLNEIQENLEQARERIVRLAVGENVNLGEEDEDD